MNRFAALVLALALVGAPTLASAEVEFGGLAGLHVFNTDSGLGVEDVEESETDMTNSLKNSAIFGFRLGVFFGMFGVEAEGGVIPTEPRDLVFDVYAGAFRGSLVAQFRAASADTKIIPFVLAGAGAIKIFDSANETEIQKEQNIAIHAGAGLKYRAANNWGVRLDVRGLLVPSNTGGQTFDVETILGIYKEWGRPTSKTVAPPPPKTDDDPDKDGIIGAADKCPTEPEDMDSFEDDNGCPDGDNDADGLADATDKCPIEPEDKDSFQDDDGCPDPDNDGDGVPDAADKCADQPETKNGFEDDDGCPDEIPEKLRQFTGAIQGITFKTNSADLAGASAKTLDKAVAVLAEFKDIKLEIQGHTDDQPLKSSKTFADNTALSQARAETVKAYFVSKGIDESRVLAKGYGDTSPVEAPTGLKGGKLTAARAKNRRVEFKLISSIDTAAEATAPAPTPTPDTPSPAPAPTDTPNP
ncbi:MAG: OmpA/MotB domain protein [Myxococcales bacterium]|nr:OmpA/MotB domain protein [Myxococcales bacterium]